MAAFDTDATMIGQVIEGVQIEHPDRLDEEAVPIAPAAPAVQGPEEAGLLEIGPAILGAEGVAVATVVAEVLEDRELVARAEAHLAGLTLAVQAGRRPETVLPGGTR